MTMADYDGERPMFELSDPHLSGVEEGLFGPWEIVEVDDEGSFDAPGGGPGADEGQAWLVNLPRDQGSAERQFAAGEVRLEATKAALKTLPEQLDAFVNIYASSKQVDDELAFDVVAPAKPTLGPEEAALWDSLQALEREQVSDEDEDESFDIAGVDLGETAEQAKALIEHLQKWLRHFARVETRRGDTLFGYTVVGWTGDFRTAWLADTSPGRKRMHARSLSMALAWRYQLLHTFLLTVETIIKLWAAVSMPILALPIIWSYINKILKARERSHI